MTADGEATIRALAEGWATAVRAGDVEARLADYAPEVISFDAVDDLQRVGLAALRERLTTWLGSFDGPIDYSFRDLSVTAGEDVAFLHCLSHVRGTSVAAGKIDMWVRTTMCLAQRGDKWLILHEHTSSPFDGSTGRALMDAQP